MKNNKTFSTTCTFKSSLNFLKSIIYKKKYLRYVRIIGARRTGLLQVESPRDQIQVQKIVTPHVFLSKFSFPFFLFLLFLFFFTFSFVFQIFLTFYGFSRFFTKKHSHSNLFSLTFQLNQTIYKFLNLIFFFLALLLYILCQIKPIEFIKRLIKFYNLSFISILMTKSHLFLPYMTPSIEFRLSVINSYFDIVIIRR